MYPLSCDFKYHGASFFCLVPLESVPCPCLLAATDLIPDYVDLPLLEGHVNVIIYRQLLVSGSFHLA